MSGYWGSWPGSGFSHRHRAGPCVRPRPPLASAAPGTDIGLSAKQQPGRGRVIGALGLGVGFSHRHRAGPCVRPRPPPVSAAPGTNIGLSVEKQPEHGLVSVPRCLVGGAPGPNAGLSIKQQPNRCPASAQGSRPRRSRGRQPLELMSASPSTVVLCPCMRKADVFCVSGWRSPRPQRRPLGQAATQSLPHIRSR